MESEEPRQRREAIAALASVRLRGIGARRSSDAWLRREILDAFARERAGKLGEGRQVGVEPGRDLGLLARSGDPTAPDSSASGAVGRIRPTTEVLVAGFESGSRDSLDETY